MCLGFATPNERLNAMTRRLGQTEREVTPLGLGCMGMSWGYAESSRDDERSVDVIREALSSGIDLIDTAGVYGDGHNERLVGRAIQGRRDDVVIATKGGLVVDDIATFKMHRDGRPKTLKQQIDESLARLGIERIDLFYLHRVDPQVPLTESWGALAEAVDAGKVRWLGLSEVTIAEAEIAHQAHPVTAIQSELSLWTRDPLGDSRGERQKVDADGGALAGGGAVTDGDLVAWTRGQGVTFVPFAPLGRGYLTGTLSANGFEASDFRAEHPRFSTAAFAHNQAITETVATIAASHAATPAQIALAWLLDLSDHIIPIPGTRSITHLRENLASSTVQLTPGERRTLTELPAPLGSRY